MEESTVVSSFVAFFSTTVDDFAVMLVFFSQANKMENVTAGYGRVILGQSMAFSIVVLISLVGLLLGVFVPTKYIDLVGFIPLIMGIMKVQEVVIENGWCGYPKQDETEDSAGSTDAVGNPMVLEPKEKYAAVSQEENSTHGEVEMATLGEVLDDSEMKKDASDEVVEIDLNSIPVDVEAAPEAITSSLEKTESDKEEEEQESNILADWFKHTCVHCLDPFVLEVMVFGLVCSSDNIAIYTSIFASVSPLQAVLVIVLFYLLLISNIIVAIFLMRVSIVIELGSCLCSSDCCEIFQCKSVAECFEDNSKYIVPLLLMGLGVYILSESAIWPGKH